MVLLHENHTLEVKDCGFDSCIGQQDEDLPYRRCTKLRYKVNRRMGPLTLGNHQGKLSMVPSKLGNRLSKSQVEFNAKQRKAWIKLPFNGYIHQLNACLAFENTLELAFVISPRAVSL